MAFYLVMNCDSGFLPQPRFQDRVQAASFRRTNSDDKLVPGVAPFAADRCATPGAGRHYAEKVSLPTEAERAAVAERAAGRQLVALARLAFEVLAQPRLTVGHERLRQPLGLAPASGRPGWHRHDGLVSRIDGQAQMPGPRRSPKRAFEAPTGEP